MGLETGEEELVGCALFDMWSGAFERAKVSALYCSTDSLVGMALLRELFTYYSRSRRSSAVDTEFNRFDVQFQLQKRSIWR